MNYDKMTKEQVIGLLKDALEYIGKQEDRTNKAIEYIKANAMFDGKICCDDLYTSDCDKLIKILEGE